MNVAKNHSSKWISISTKDAGQQSEKQVLLEQIQVFSPFGHAHSAKPNSSQS
jgi:hypothetical protein